MNVLVEGSGMFVSVGLGALLAYVNPGTGSLVLQMVLIGLATAVVGVKAQWRTIWSFLKGRNGKPKL